MGRRGDSKPARRRSVLPVVLVLIAAALITYALTIFLQVTHGNGG
jgi:hypothetical protein